MTQEERRRYLIHYLLEERIQFEDMPEEKEASAEDPMTDPRIPAEAEEQKRLLRGLLNIRAPRPAGSEFLTIQDAYLQEAIREKGIVRMEDLTPVCPGIYLWQGDITRLACDVIVNAANAQMLGCFCPNHGCIDNAIHTFSGVQLRAACEELMRRQGRDEETGHAKLTPAFNLPCKYVLHTVGPIVRGWLTRRDQELLASCYRSCLELADVHGLKSVAFCCISTGEFHFPNEKAAQIAVQTVKEYQQQTDHEIEVIFNVFKDRDKEIYRRLLQAD